MATIRMVSYAKLLKYLLEYCYQFKFAKFCLILLKTQDVRKPPHAKLKKKILNFHIQTVLSTAVVDVFISNQVN